MADPASIDFYFDPGCPWCWRTALWADKAAKDRKVAINWKLFSLAVVNHGKDYNADAHNKGFRHERMLLLARREHGNAAIEKLYMRLGEAQHGRRDDTADEGVIQAVLKESGLPEDLYARSLADPTTESELLAEHEKAVADLGAFGVPTIGLPGSTVAWFGPIIEPIPQGAESQKLFDFMLLSLDMPYMYEMKRERRLPGRLGPQHVLD